jgi:hypothetical protein
MMAVAALSLRQKDSTARLDALQHYQQALPALQINLRSADDFYSDGGFLTHFMLLVYEVSLTGRSKWPLLTPFDVAHFQMFHRFDYS